MAVMLSPADSTADVLASMHLNIKFLALVAGLQMFWQNMLWIRIAVRDAGSSLTASFVHQMTMPEAYSC